MEEEKEFTKFTDCKTRDDLINALKERREYCKAYKTTDEKKSFMYHTIDGVIRLIEQSLEKGL